MDNILKIHFSRGSEKALKKLYKSNKKLAQNIGEQIQNLRKNPHPHDSIGLTGYYPYMRIRVGKYRIIYKYDTQSLYIIVIGKREDIYKHIQALLQ